MKLYVRAGVTGTGSCSCGCVARWTLDGELLCNGCLMQVLAYQYLEATAYRGLGDRPRRVDGAPRGGLLRQLPHEDAA